MKAIRSKRLIAALFGFLTSAGISAMAQHLVVVDEYGHGTYNGISLPSQSAGTLGLQTTFLTSSCRARWKCWIRWVARLAMF